MSIPISVSSDDGNRFGLGTLASASRGECSLSNSL